jgi:hypothetical protein
MPPPTRLAKINPTIAASTVTVAEIRTAWVCSDRIVEMAPQLAFCISMRVARSLRKDAKVVVLFEDEQSCVVLTAGVSM